MATKTEAPLKPRERVVATHDFRGIAEGAAGRIRMVNGLASARYWIQWDGDHWMGNVLPQDVVRESDWDDFKQRRKEEALRPKVEAAPTPEAGGSGESGGDAGGGTAGGAGAGRVPTHLLERSRAARARKATAEGS